MILHLTVPESGYRPRHPVFQNIRVAAGSTRALLFEVAILAEKWRLLDD